MKCKQCGAAITLDVNFCPYCGTENSQYKLQRKQMFHLKRDYEKTKEKVLKENQRIAASSVKLTVIAILIALNFVIWFLAGNAWDIMHDYKYSEERKNIQLHREKLTEYEENSKYLMLAAYYDEHLLYSIEELEEFRKVYQACSNYEYVYSMIMNLYHPENYLSKEESIKNICDNLAYMYEAMEKEEYDNPKSFEGQHKKTMDSLKREVELLLVTYTKITKEEAERFEQMSDGQRQIALERGLGLYED
ncbi:MAG: zinc ribbon domain-containing protein [Lachnospiraceae bacterium]|nr:zinc ribbon domain-containing protein [Lachnospiraceae bacterium]